jgi:hypothetical protein
MAARSAQAASGTPVGGAALCDHAQMKTSDWLLLLGALALGLVVALVDLSPGWDDTGVSAAAVFVVAAVFGAARPSRAWLWALAVGLWIPVLGIVVRGNAAALIALVPALLGALAGAAARRLLAGPGGAV